MKRKQRIEIRNLKLDSEIRMIAFGNSSNDLKSFGRSLRDIAMMLKDRSEAPTNVWRLKLLKRSCDPCNRTRTQIAKPNTNPNTHKAKLCLA